MWRTKFRLCQVTSNVLNEIVLFACIHILPKLEPHGPARASKPWYEIDPEIDPKSTGSKSP